MEPTLPNKPDLTKNLSDPIKHPTDPTTHPTDPARAAGKAPARPKGPNASAIVFGLVAMVLAGLVIAKETLDLQVDWSRVGPGGVIGLGVVMALIGAVGLVRRHDDS